MINLSSQECSHLSQKPFTRKRVLNALYEFITKISILYSFNWIVWIHWIDFGMNSYALYEFTRIVCIHTHCMYSYALYVIIPKKCRIALEAGSSCSTSGTCSENTKFWTVYIPARSSSSKVNIYGIRCKSQIFRFKLIDSRWSCFLSVLRIVIGAFFTDAPKIIFCR